MLTWDPKLERVSSSNGHLSEFAWLTVIYFTT